MKRAIRKRILTLLLIFTLLSGIVFANNKWELEIKKNGIRVYTKLEAGNQYKTFKATTVINASMEEIINILKDGNGYVNWFAFTKKAKLLEITSNELYVYIETALPWPFNNEDMIYKMTFTAEAKAITKVKLKGMPDYLPSIEGINRMKKANGYILLKSIGNETEITYSMYSELGGYIPFWMANKSIYELPYQTLNNLKKVLKQ